MIQCPLAWAGHVLGQEKDMVVGPDDIALAFLDYFDFGKTPIEEDFHFYRCEILSFPSRSE